jgi:hypothetical protein
MAHSSHNFSFASKKIADNKQQVQRLDTAKLPGGFAKLQGAGSSSQSGLTVTNRTPPACVQHTSKQKLPNWVAPSTLPHTLPLRQVHSHPSPALSDTPWEA